jgi:hypothetical protein
VSKEARKRGEIKVSHDLHERFKAACIRAGGVSLRIAAERAIENEIEALNAQAIAADDRRKRIAAANSAR